MFPFLLSMQAAGTVVDWLGTHNQIEMGKQGAQLEQSSIESNIENARLQTEDATLQSLRKLRQNLGTQMAIQAGRGTASGVGTAALFSMESINNFSEDQRARQLNLLGNENRLKSGLAISKLNESASESKLWSDFTSRTTNRFPTTKAGWDAWKSNLKSWS